MTEPRTVSEPAIAGQPSLAAFVLVLAIACSWIVYHPYLGIWHDAELYTLQALAHLEPRLLAGDLFLRFGSQDAYTVFSPIYARAIAAFGLEHAAALLTLVSQALFVAATWLLARRLLPPGLLWLGIGFVIAMPGDYGAGHTLQYMENFLTPRLASEALVLAALAAMAAGRLSWSWVSLVAAALLHPLMAAAGVGVVVCVQAVTSARHLPRTLWLIPIAAAMLGLLATAFGMLPRFDPAWFELVRRKHYLFVSEWTLADWSRIAVPLAVAAAGSLLLPSSGARVFCGASLLVGIAGIVLTLSGADLLHVVLVTQMQPWRALWITSFVSVLLLPLILSSAWKRGPLGRASALFLVAARFLHGDGSSLAHGYALAVAAAGIALAVAAARERGTVSRERRMILAGAWLAIAVGAVWTLADLQLAVQGTLDQSHAPALVRILRTLGGEGALPTLFLTAVWWICRSLSRARLLASALAMSAACGLLLPVAAAAWSRVIFTPALSQAFGSWRRLIPIGDEVYWPTDALSCWVLLERPSYLSQEQSTAAVFSRKAGFEFERRSLRLEALEESRKFHFVSTTFPDSSAPSLKTICDDTRATYFVTGYDLKGAPPLALAPAGVAPYYRMLRLYRCSRE